MSIELVTSDDVIELLKIAKLAIRDTVDAPNNAKREILDGISNNIMEWHYKDNCAFYKFTSYGITKGFVLIKDYWNLSDIFVLPEFQRQGIGRSLAEHAIEACGKQEDVKTIRVNSSRNAVFFYRSLGFKETVINKDLPYGIVPFEYKF